MRPAPPFVLRPEYRDIPHWLARMPQQGEDKPTLRDGDSGAVVPTNPNGPNPGPGPVPNNSATDPMAGCFSTPNLIMIAAMFAVMYFFVIRPQRKQEQERQALLSSVKAGDKIVTTGGIHAVIESVSDQTIRIRVDQTIMTIDRAAVGRVVRDGVAAAAGGKA